MENRKAIAMTLELKPVVEDVSNIISNFKAVSFCFSSKAYLTGLKKTAVKIWQGDSAVSNF